MRRLAVIFLAGALPLGARAAPAPTAPAHPEPSRGTSAASADLVELTQPQQVRAVCLAARPVEEVPFTGSPVEKAKAKDAFQAAHQSAMKKLYLVRAGASGFRLGDYDSDAQTLALDLSRPLRLLYGALEVAFAVTEPLVMPMPPDIAKAASASVAAGTARLDAYFELNDDLGPVCSGSVAAGVFTVSARPVAFELRDGSGKLLGRVETPLADAHRAVLGGYTGKPEAQVGPVTVQDNVDAKALARKLREVEDPLTRCYVQRLQQKPDAGGTVVLGVEVDADGRVRSVDFTADALQDAALHACVDSSVRALRFSGVVGLPTLFRVPIELKLVRP